MRDRAESGRGRPWDSNSLKAVARLEADMRKQRKVSVIRSEMIYTCPVTRTPMIYNYPQSLSYAEALREVMRRDRNHNHKAWETFTI